MPNYTVSGNTDLPNKQWKVKRTYLDRNWDQRTHSFFFCWKNHKSVHMSRIVFCVFQPSSSQAWITVKNSDISRTSFLDNSLDFNSRRVLKGFDHFQNGRAFPGSEIVSSKPTLHTCQRLHTNVRVRVNCFCICSYRSLHILIFSFSFTETSSETIP